MTKFLGSVNLPVNQTRPLGRNRPVPAGNYAEIGITCQSERHLGLRDNFSFSEVPAAQIETMTREVAKEKPDAITIICTNLHAAPSVAKLERETGIPVYDTIATVVWKCLKLAGVDTKRVTGWGSLFQQV